MTFKRGTAIVVLSSTLLVSALISADAMVSNSTVSVSTGDVRISASSTNLSGDNITFAQVLSSRYSRAISAREVTWLRTEFDFGFGDVSLAYATSVYSGRSVDEISQLRLKNMGWGEIAKLYGVKVKDLKKGNNDVVNMAHERGMNITYVEIDEDRNSDNRRQDEYQAESQKNGHKKDKHDNGKGNGPKK